RDGADGASAWSIVPSPTIGGGELMSVATRTGSDAWAVGSRSSGGVFAPLAEHWNGSTWSSVPIGAPGSFNQLRAVAVVSHADVWAVGVSNNWSALIEHWNGST